MKSVSKTPDGSACERVLFNNWFASYCQCHELGIQILVTHKPVESLLNRICFVFSCCWLVLVGIGVICCYWWLLFVTFRFFGCCWLLSAVIGCCSRLLVVIDCYEAFSAIVTYSLFALFINRWPGKLLCGMLFGCTGRFPRAQTSATSIASRPGNFREISPKPTDWWSLINPTGRLWTYSCGSQAVAFWCQESPV